MGRGTNRNKICRCGSGKKAKKCCLAPKIVKPQTDFRIEKLSNEGSASPRVARLLLGLPEIVEHTTLSDQKKELIKGKLLELHKLLVEADEKVAPLLREIARIQKSLEGGKTTFDSAGVAIDLPKTSQLNLAVDLLRRLGSGLTIVREILSCIYDQYFTDLRFIDFKVFLDVKLPKDHILNKLMTDDQAWISSLETLCQQARDGQSVLKDFSATRDSSRALIIGPSFSDSTPIAHFIEVFTYNVFTFCEEMVVFSLEKLVYEKLSIYELPEGSRDKESPQRFRIGIKPGVPIAELGKIPELIHIYRSGQQFYHLREQARIAKYGHVGSTIHGNYKGKKMVCIGSTFYYSSQWKTFVDFLHHYIKHCFGEAWWKAQVARPLSERSAVLQWAALAHQHEKTSSAPNSDGIFGVDPNGPMHAYLSFGYELYILDKHGLLRTRLMKRLKIDSEFQGARYEVFVAATCIKAGFKLEWEDDTDNTRRHAEFKAVHFTTGQEFAVEAKRRQRSSGKEDLAMKPLGLDSLLEDAFGKFDGKPLIIFVELDLSPVQGNPLQQPWTKELLEVPTKAGGRDSESGKDRFNMIIYTNRPTGDDSSNFPSHMHIGSVSLVPEVQLISDIPLRLLADTMDKTNLIPSWFEE